MLEKERFSNNIARVTPEQFSSGKGDTLFFFFAPEQDIKKEFTRRRPRSCLAAGLIPF